MISLGLDRIPVEKAAGADLITHLPTWPSRGGGWWGGWFGGIGEWFPGSWQRHLRYTAADVMTFGTVWACITSIAGDIAKLWLNLVEEDANGIITPAATNVPFWAVIKKPNHFQTRVKFFEYWLISKLTTGNTYVLKERDNRGIVVALYVLDPSRVQVLVAPDGDVYYQLSTDYLSGLRESSVTVPAREIIHDICVPLYHPLCGVSPIHACGMAAMQGLRIQEQAARFAAQGFSASGVLTAPGTISAATAERLEKYWNENFTGESGRGKIAALGDGLKFERMMMTAVDAQLIEQLRWTAEHIPPCFHVPGYMVGVGAPPPYTDIQSINLQYYTQALQNPIENIELLLNEGLDLPKPYSVEFDLDALARMDGKTQMAIAKDGVGGGIFSPNEGRARFNLKPVQGGDSPMMQQQQYSLAALDRRDAQQNPPPTGPATPQSPAPPAPAEPTPRAAAGDLHLLALAAAECCRKALAA